MICWNLQKCSSKIISIDRENVLKNVIGKFSPSLLLYLIGIAFLKMLRARYTSNVKVKNLKSKYGKEIKPTKVWKIVINAWKTKLESD